MSISPTIVPTESREAERRAGNAAIHRSDREQRREMRARGAYFSTTLMMFSSSLAYFKTGKLIT